MIYEGLEDVYGAPGKWSIRRCSNPECGLLWLDPQPLAEDIGKAYDRYYTHEGATARATVLRRIYGWVRASYLRSELGYAITGSDTGWRWLAPIANLHPGGADAFAASVMFLPSPRLGASLLDIGCGGGELMVRMRDRGWTVAGREPGLHFGYSSGAWLTPLEPSVMMAFGILALHGWSSGWSGRDLRLVWVAILFTIPAILLTLDRPAWLTATVGAGCSSHWPTQRGCV